MSNDFDWFALAAGLALLAAAEESGAIAQLAEHPAHNRECGGSMPSGLTKDSCGGIEGSHGNGCASPSVNSGRCHISGSGSQAPPAGIVSGTADGIKPPALSMEAELPENPGAYSPVDECAPGEDFMEMERRTR